MRSRWVPRLAILAVVGTSLWGAATPAWANSTAVLNQTGVFADKTKFGTCTEKPDQSPNEDVWVFVWPGNNAGDLVHLTLNFDINGDNVADAQRTEADATKTTDNGTLKVWVTTPAGWKLLNGSSEITGTVPQSQFQLTHSCGGTSVTTPPTPPTSPPPSPSESAGSTPGTPPGSSPGGGNSGGLPITGTSVGGIVAVGLGLVAAGIALIALRRRRDILDSDA